MKHKLALLPLDERAENRVYPGLLGKIAGFTVLVPPLEYLGKKRTPGNLKAIGRWLEHMAPEVDGLIIALDTLGYGGLIPSRTSHQSYEEVMSNLAVLKEIKASKPDVPIYGFATIMRVAHYNGNEEEPEYWSEYGLKISSFSRLTGRCQCQPEEKIERDLAALKDEIPGVILADYTGRRERNHRVLKEVIGWTKEGILDRLLITQDDNCEFGFGVMEQGALSNLLRELGLVSKVPIHPGADETGMVLTARMIDEFLGFEPHVYLRFSSAIGPQLIARYEDRPLQESIKGQVVALGGIIVDQSAEADFVLCVNTPGKEQSEPFLPDARDRVNNSGRNLLEFVTAIDNYLRKNIPVAIADVGYCNGGDDDLVSLLNEETPLQDLTAYAGWNTASNTIGTALAQASIYLASRKAPGAGREDKAPAREKAQLEFLFLRLINDWAYQGKIRTAIVQREIKKVHPWEWDISGREEEFTVLIQEELSAFANQYFAEKWHSRIRKLHEGPWNGYRLNSLRLENFHLPWHRLFEFDVDLEIQGQMI